MDRIKENGLIIAATVLGVLVLGGASRLLNGVVWRVGKIGILIALFALVYSFIRKKA